jgi:hypothetical protein
MTKKKFEIIIHRYTDNEISNLYSVHEGATLFLVPVQRKSKSKAIPVTGRVGL